MKNFDKLPSLQLDLSNFKPWYWLFEKCKLTVSEIYISKNGLKKIVSGLSNGKLVIFEPDSINVDSQESKQHLIVNPEIIDVSDRIGSDFGAVECLNCSEQPKILVGSNNSKLVLLDISDESQRKHWNFENFGSLKCMVIYNKNCIAGFENGSVLFIDLNAFEKEEKMYISTPISHHMSAVGSLALTSFSPKSILFVGYKKGMIRGYLLENIQNISAKLIFKVNLEEGEELTKIMLCDGDKILCSASWVNLVNPIGVHGQVKLFHWKESNSHYKKQTTSGAIWSVNQNNKKNSIFFGTRFNILQMDDNLVSQKKNKELQTICKGNEKESIMAILNDEDRIFACTSGGSFDIQMWKKAIPYEQFKKEDNQFIEKKIQKSTHVPEDSNEPEKNEKFKLGESFTYEKPEEKIWSPSESLSGKSNQTSKSSMPSLQQPIDFEKAYNILKSENKKIKEELKVARQIKEKLLMQNFEEIEKNEQPNLMQIIEKKENFEQEKADFEQEKTNYKQEKVKFDQEKSKLRMLQIEMRQMGIIFAEKAKLFSHFMLENRISQLPKSLLKKIDLQSELWIDRDMFQEIWRHKERKKLKKGKISSIYLSQQKNEEIIIKFSSKKIPIFLELFNEAILLKLCKHENIIDVKNIFLEPRPRKKKESDKIPKIQGFRLQILLEKLEQTLWDALFEKKLISKNEEKRKLCWNIVDGLQHIHSLAIVHGDLHAGNIMFDSKKQVWKIIDLGNAQKLKQKNAKEGKSEYGSFVAHCIPIQPPEIWEESTKKIAQISPKFDIWALGILFYQIFTDNTKFNHVPAPPNKGLVYKNLFSHNLNSKENLDRSIVNLIAKCTRVKREKRPNIFKVKELLKLIKF